MSFRSLSGAPAMTKDRAFTAAALFCGGRQLAGTRPATLDASRNPAPDLKICCTGPSREIALVGRTGTDTRLVRFAALQEQTAPPSWP